MRYPDLSPAELVELAGMVRRLLALLPADGTRADARMRARLAELAGRLEAADDGLADQC